MKHLSAHHARLLRAGISEMGLQIDQASTSQMLLHLDWVLETTRTMNLTAITDPNDAVRLHLLDSLVALPEVISSAPGRLLDIGSGAGFPGLPLALASGRSALLVDSVSKKMEALQRFLVQESLDSWISVSTSRVEGLTLDTDDRYAMVTARAVAALPSLVELASPLLVSGGRLIALKSRPDADELARAEVVAAQCGMRFEASRDALLPGGDEKRAILTYLKVAKPRITLPRRVGMAQKNPLA